MAYLFRERKGKQRESFLDENPLHSQPFLVTKPFERLVRVHHFCEGKLYAYFFDCFKYLFEKEFMEQSNNLLPFPSLPDADSVTQEKLAEFREKCINYGMTMHHLELLSKRQLINPQPFHITNYDAPDTMSFPSRISLCKLAGFAPLNNRLYLPSNLLFQNQTETQNAQTIQVDATIGYL